MSFRTTAFIVAGLVTGAFAAHRSGLLVRLGRATTVRTVRAGAR